MIRSHVKPCGFGGFIVALESGIFLSGIRYFVAVSLTDEHEAVSCGFYLRKINRAVVLR